MFFAIVFEVKNLELKRKLRCTKSKRGIQEEFEGGNEFFNSTFSMHSANIDNCKRSSIFLRNDETHLCLIQTDRKTRKE